jgi:beta-N-acetylhexosaminidase
MTDKYRRVDKLLGEMNLEQKIGQLFVFSLCGCKIYPDTYERLIKMNCSGFRVHQAARMFRRYRRPGSGEFQGNYRVPRGQDRDFVQALAPYSTAPQFAAHLNRVKELAKERPLGIPVHMVLDQEGDNSANFLRGGVRFFPAPMGLAAAEDKTLCYRVSKALARQLRAVGINMIHSPVLDVNTNPDNPEIGTRAFSDDPEICAEFALEMYRAFKEDNLIAAAKHFPGRGASREDAHFDVPLLDLSRRQLDDIDLLPYRRLIEAGLPVVMIAHTVYPALDASGDIATVSKAIVSDLLRGELGFDGVITTDSISMGALVKQCGDLPEACVRSVEAGADLVLLKDDDWVTVKAYEAMLDAVKSGRIKESQIDSSVERTLKMKVDYGLFDDCDIVEIEQVQKVFDDPAMAEIETEAARKTITLMRDEAGLLPLTADKKVMLVEQTSDLALYVNDLSCHPAMFWEEMLKQSPANVMMTEADANPTEQDLQRVRDRLDQAELLVMTNNYYRGQLSGPYTAFIREIIKSGKAVIVVSNTPYEMTAPEDFPTVICTYGNTPAALRETAKMLFGKVRPEGRIKLKKLRNDTEYE